MEHIAREIECQYNYRDVFVMVKEKPDGTYWWTVRLLEGSTIVLNEMDHAPTFEIAKHCALHAVDNYWYHVEASLDSQGLE